MDLSNFFSGFDLFKVLSHWIVQVFIVIFVTMLANFVQRRILRRIHRKCEQSKNIWDDAIIKSVQAPLTLLFWIIGLSFSLQIIEHETGKAIFGMIPSLRYLGIVATFAWCLYRFIGNVSSNIITRWAKKGKTVDKTTIDGVTKILRASVIVTSVLVALQTLGVSISGVLAFGGIGGIAVGFAAKDLLANFFGGFMLYWDRPFNVGDWIRSADREIEGTVEHIGWRLTCIRTFDKRPLYVPNAIFNTIAVENPSRMTHRRIYETVGLRYDDAANVSVILQEIRDMLIEHSEIDESQTLMVNLITFAPYSLDFFIYTFTHTTVWTRFHEIKEEILLKISTIIASHGAEIALPTSTVHLPGMHPESLDLESGKMSLPEPILLKKKQNITPPSGQ